MEVLWLAVRMHSPPPLFLTLNYLTKKVKGQNQPFQKTENRIVNKENKKGPKQLKYL